MSAMWRRENQQEEMVRRMPISIVIVLVLVIVMLGSCALRYCGSGKDRIVVDTTIEIPSEPTEATTVVETTAVETDETESETETETEPETEMTAEAVKYVIRLDSKTSKFSLYVGEKFQAPTFGVYDTEGNRYTELDKLVQLEGEVDTSKAGRYVLRWFFDHEEHIISKYATVDVLQKAPSKTAVTKKATAQAVAPVVWETTAVAVETTEAPTEAAETAGWGPGFDPNLGYNGEVRETSSGNNVIYSKGDTGSTGGSSSSDRHHYSGGGSSGGGGSSSDWYPPSSGGDSGSAGGNTSDGGNSNQGGSTGGDSGSTGGNGGSSSGGNTGGSDTKFEANESNNDNVGNSGSAGGSTSGGSSSGGGGNFEANEGGSDNVGNSGAAE